MDKGIPINQTLHDYWIERVVVPGDGTAIWHRAYIEDGADTLRMLGVYSR